MQRLILGLVLLALPAVAAAQTQTIGLFRNDPGTFPGYTLFSPLEYTDTYLIDNQGELVHSWSTPYPIGNMAYLEEDGTLFRTADPGGNDVFVWGGDAGLVQQLDWDGTVLWEFLYSDSTVRLHHDIEVMPNGNVLMIAWEYKSQAECIAAGRDDFLLPDGELWPDHLIEVEPIFPSGGNIVWEWHAWDHLIQDFDPAQNNYGVVEDHPELIDINYMQDPLADWLHFNAIDYNPDLDLIAISTPRFDEMWIIDHSTTTAEAAGHTGGRWGKGGDLLYRWGNPQRYGANGKCELFGQHDARWLVDEHGFSAPDAIGVVERAYRGGGVARDVGYLHGWLRVRAALASGRTTIDHMRAGRVGIEAAAALPELIQQGLARVPRHRPSLERSLLATESGNSLETSPPSVAASFTMLEET